MSSFFDPPPPSTPPAPPPALRLPPWAGPPARVLGELVWDRLVIYRASELAVTLEHLRAYPEGFEFRLCVRARHALSAFGYPGVGIIAVGPASVPGRHVLPTDHHLRLGLGFSDGTRVTTLSPIMGVGLGGAPPKPLLVQQGANGIGARWDQRYWVWGLPPEGPLAVVVEWTGHGVPEAKVDLDAGAIRAAAEAAESLWEEEPDSSPAPAGSSVTSPGMFTTAQCQKPRTVGASGSTMVTTKLFVPAGKPLQDSCGEMS